MARHPLIYDDSTGEFISVPAPVVAYPGNGTVGPFTITHNFGTLGTYVVVILNSTGEEVEVHKVRTQNTVVLSPDVVWNANERTVTVGWACQTDNTPPTTASLAYVSKTNVSITVTPSGATDAESGVAGYLIYKDGVVVNGFSTLAPGGVNYVVTGLSSNTSYSITAKAVDNGGNVSTAFSTAVVQTTNASTPVAYNAFGAHVDNTVGAASDTTVQSITVAAGSNNIIIASCIISGVGTTSYPFTSVSCTDSVGGAMTLLGNVTINNGSGHLLVYYLLNAAVGAHTVTFSANTGATWHDFQRMNLVAYSNVGSIVLRATRTGQAGSAALNAAVTSSVDNMAFCAMASDASAITLTAGTSRVNGGANGNGTGDFLRVADLPGAATATFTSSNSTIHGYITADLQKV